MIKGRKLIIENKIYKATDILKKKQGESDNYLSLASRKSISAP